MDLPVLADRTFRGDVTVNGTLTQTGNATFAGNVTLSTGTLSAGELVTEVIADPGDSGAIPVTNSGTVAITTAGAETRTIAAPSFDGQMLSVFFDVDGGDCVITVASAVNQTGNNTLTGADAGDHIMLIAGQVGGSLVWRVVANDGWALTTV